MRVRVLLDECVPVRIAAELPNQDVRTIRGMRWRGQKNGELLALAEQHFDVFVTMDRALTQQQRVAQRRLGIVTLAAKTNEIETLRALIPALRQALMKVKAGQVIRVSSK